jgi:hypothetical protein
MYIFFMQLVSKVKTKQSLKGRVMWLGGVKGGAVDGGTEKRAALYLLHISPTQ